MQIIRKGVSRKALRVNCLLSKRSGNKPHNPVKDTVGYLKKNDLALLVADKEGGFVVMPKGVFRGSSYCKKLCYFNEYRRGTEKESHQPLYRVGSVKGMQKYFQCEERFVDFFLFSKNAQSKHAFPSALSRFIQKHLHQLPVNGPFLARNSTKVVEFLSEQHFCGESFYVFSVDAEELFYSLPQDAFVCAVRDCIDDFGPVAFQNSVGVSVEKFLELPRFNLSSTVVHFSDEYVVQREGICIGSCIAPILSDLVLAYFYKRIASCLDTATVATVFRYIDDYLVILKGVELHRRTAVVDSL